MTAPDYRDEYDPEPNDRDPNLTPEEQAQDQRNARERAVLRAGVRRRRGWGR